MEPVIVRGIKLNLITTFVGKHKNIRFKITKWKGGDRLIWNYYLCIDERTCRPEVWKELWLEPENPSPGRNYVSYPYMSMFSRVRYIEMHGGITYYQKHGEVIGHRCIEVGCDYSHFYDHERGDYSIEEVVTDLGHSIDSAIVEYELQFPCYTPTSPVPPEPECK